ncbi:hypothetical protein MON38_15340 [Hymenobacter sp. DH14]|uniref:Uncharacterized protein n=1 Tax=Hymenobacter cyanobacteriorum TaxID=2926463 RepID=A0A9X2AGG4_9BACT|nr:hypothetical protein [Hymenobacter cyanobacteriorum]MCI1188797.1 hypothetical protein [Hymenobacter cyanobacteriorum]
MKSSYLLLLLLFGSVSAKAQVTRELKKIDSLVVPVSIIRQFYKLAPTSKKVSWTFEHTTQVAGPDYDFYRSEFRQDDNPGGTTFVGDGKLLDFQVYARLDTLPPIVQKTIRGRLKKVKRQYPNAVMDICVMGNVDENPDTHQEKLNVMYSVEFFESVEGRLALKRLHKFAIDNMDNKGRIIKESKGHVVDFR